MDGELVPVVELVAHDAQVGELVDKEFEFLFGFLDGLRFFWGTAEQYGGESKGNH